MIAQKKITGSGAVRSTTRLRAELEKSLSAYAVAAAAAGVSLFALASSAEAKVIYTPAHTMIPINGAPVLLDLNHDGIADFSFVNSLASNHSDAIWLLLRAGAKSQSNEIWGRGSFYASCCNGAGEYAFASALRADFKVGPRKSYFQNKHPWAMAFDVIGFSTSRTYGQWQQAKHRYLGLKFMISGQVHYGWARVSVHPIPNQGGFNATLTGYAYESIPNKPIIAGKTKGPDVITLEPATLGQLAQGSSGISAWRGRK